jgi:hypothetical protein
MRQSIEIVIGFVNLSPVINVKNVIGNMEPFIVSDFEMAVPVMIRAP